VFGLEPARGGKAAALRFQIASDTPVEGWSEDRDERDKPIFVSSDVILTEFDVIDAASIHSETTHGVQLAFVGMGADRLGTFTAKNVGKRLAIYVDDKIVASPRIYAGVRDRAVITGDFTREEARELARRLMPQRGK
jgi:preprotein translocase subunit SecD